jgi:hypothetical protein
MLRKIFGPKREEITGKWKNMHKEYLPNLYSSADHIMVIKSSRVR